MKNKTTSGDVDLIGEETLPLYTEKDTNWIYEAQIFDTAVIVRPISPELYRGIKRITVSEFEEQFHEFGGVASVARNLVSKLGKIDD